MNFRPESFFLPINFEQVKESPLSMVLLALGSNFQAEMYLNHAIKQLSKLGKIHLSKAFINPDYTATLDSPKPDYTNLCIILQLDSVETLRSLINTLKAIESRCDRERKNSVNTRGLVSLDIDVLALQTKLNEQWLAIDKRCPFKNHEWVGINELLASGAF